MMCQPFYPLDLETNMPEYLVGEECGRSPVLPPPVSPVMLDEEDEIMLSWFQHSHLPPHLAEVSAQFAVVANVIFHLCAPGTQRSLALQRLLEAKDAAVRARIENARRDHTGQDL